MASTIYSVRFIAVSDLTGIESVTVPAGKVWILRDVDIVNRTNAAAAFGVLGAAGQYIWYWDPAFNIQALAAQWRGRQVFNAGDEIGFQAASGTWDCQASGYELGVG